MFPRILTYWNYMDDWTGLHTLAISILWKQGLQHALQIKKENSKQCTFFFKIFLFLIYYCFSSNFTSLFKICFMTFFKWEWDLYPMETH
jgi:hypothetical protein